jgi:hypothetical protein
LPAGDRELAAHEPLNLTTVDNLASADLRPTLGLAPLESWEGATTMLWTLFVVLLVLWLLGLISNYTLGGFIHILLVLAIIALVYQLISGRRPIV